MQLSRTRIVAGVAVSLLVSIAWADDIAVRMETRFEPAVRRVLKDKDVPGLAIAVVHDDAVVYSKAFGVKNIDTKAPLTTDSLFHWASVTKPFVATAIMQLVEQGKIDLDASLTTYLPYFKMADERYKSITIRQMLTHTSGMPDVFNYEWNKPVYDDGALERYVRSLANKKLIAAPGTKMRYSNIAFDVLGDVIAKVSGTTFEDYVATHILQPLAMKDSTLLKKEAREDLLTSPHSHSRKKGTFVREHWPYNRMHAPSSCMISNVSDMARWAMANLNRGELDGERILKVTSYDILWTPQSPITDRDGLSWFLGNYAGHRMVFHSGGDEGFSSHLLLLPDDHIAILYAMNIDLAPRNEVTHLALDTVLNIEPNS